MSLTIENDAPCALITGATGGLGLEFCKLLAAKGYRLVVTGRDASKLAQIREEIPQAQVALAGDLTDPICLRNLIAHLKRDGITPEVLINNAGFGLYGDALEPLTPESLKMVELNIKVLTTLTLQYAKAMRENRRGYILNVASIAAFMPCPKLGIYGASKSYVLSFSESLHEELKNDGVHVTALCPGPVMTNFWTRAGISDCQSYGFAFTDARDVVESGLNGLYANRAVVVYGWVNKVLVFLAQIAPRFLVRMIAAKVLGGIQKR